MIKNYKDFVKNTEYYDDDILLSELVISDENGELYGTYDTEDFKELKDDIKKNGILEPAEVVEGTRDVEAGCTRTLACIDLQSELDWLKKIPVRWIRDRKTTLSIHKKKILARKNMGRRAHLKQQWHSIQDMIKTHIKDYGGEPTLDDIKEYCRILNIPYKRYLMLEKLNSGYWETDKQKNKKFINARADLLSRVLEPGDALSLGKAIKLQKGDAEGPTIQSRSSLLDDLILKEDVTYAVGVKTDVMRKVNSITAHSPVAGISDWNPLEDIQKNTKSGLVHESLTKALAVSINARTDNTVTAFAGNDYKEDLLVRRINGSVETKTSIVRNNKPNGWMTSTKRIKDGYYYLHGYSEDYQRVFSAYGYISHKCFKSAGPSNSVIDLDKLYNYWIKDNQFHKIFCGELKKDNDETVVMVDKYQF